jgi:hypothetical protein
MSETPTAELVKRAREIFQHRRYGGGSDYEPDFDILQPLADRLEALEADNMRLTNAIVDSALLEQDEESVLADEAVALAFLRNYIMQNSELELTGATRLSEALLWNADSPFNAASTPNNSTGEK